MAVPQTVPGPNAGKKARKVPDRKPMSSLLRSTAALDRMLSTLSQNDARALIMFGAVKLGGQARFD